MLLRLYDGHGQILNPSERAFYRTADWRDLGLGGLESCQEPRYFWGAKLLADDYRREILREPLFCQLNP